MNVKAVLRWLIRRDADAGATFLGGIINSVQPFISTVVGVQSGLLAGIGIFVVLFVVKSITGYIDWRIGATAYRNHYVSDKAPLNVRIKSDDGSRLNDMQTVSEGKPNRIEDANG